MLSQNLANIYQRIADAAVRADRLPADVKLVAVSKLVPADRIIEAVESGHLVFGENYVQEAQGKIPLVKNILPADEISL